MSKSYLLMEWARLNVELYAFRPDFKIDGLRAQINKLLETVEHI